MHHVIAVSVVSGASYLIELPNASPYDAVLLIHHRLLNRDHQRLD
jgi:hypothetical protein